METISKTRQLALLREIRATALAAMKAIEANERHGQATYTPAWFAERLNEIDGTSAQAREAMAPGSSY